MRVESLGQRIKSQRKTLGLTQEQLAELMCIPKSTISAYENDKVDIKGSVLTELSRVLETTPNYLLGVAEADPIIESISSILKRIKDEKIKLLLYAQIEAVEKMA